MLKTNKAMLIWMKVDKAKKMSVPTAMPDSWTKIAVTVAKTRLVAGPVRPIIATPYSAYRTFQGLNGTGLAMKNGGRPNSIKPKGSKTVVKMSMCFKGLSVNRPA